jgi:general secretion pathway protein A
MGDIWLVSGSSDGIVWDRDVLSRFLQEMQAGYQRYSWGGVEIGGILAGLHEGAVTRITNFLPAPSSHENGPSFDLSPPDKQQLQALIAACAREGLEPVGWFHSISNRQELLSAADRALLAEFFPDPRQFAVVVRRSRQDAPVLTLFTKPGREFVKAEYRAEAQKPADPPPTPLALATRDSFALTPNPTLFYPGRHHVQALEGLWHGVSMRKGFLLLSGESGMGKTMVLECLMDRFRQHKIEYGFLMNSRITVSDLFEMIWTDFGLGTASASKTSVLVALNNMLLKYATEGQTVALIVDDAHQLSNEVLQEIELLSNLETRVGKLLQVVFAARPEFEARLEQEELRGLRTRIMRRFRLGALSEQETAEFIRVRLKANGSSAIPAELFSEIHKRTGGVPRMITALCGAAIERSEEIQTKAVDTELLDRVASEFGM